MAEHSEIEWTDATWNVITGCTVVSPGCTNCYAMKMAGTRMKSHPSRVGLTKPSKAGPVWAGVVRFNEQWLGQPLQWKHPRRIFVCAHGDLFHESVPDEWIDRVFTIMALCPQHTFQVLTKRSKRMREYCEKIEIEPVRDTVRRIVAAWPGSAPVPHEIVLPLSNVWLGVSAEDQTRADERIPDLLATPAAVRWVSAEPLSGHINFTEYLHDSEPRDVHLDWIVVGGESGPRARPMHPDWARSIRDQCRAAGVPFLFKQWGEFLPYDEDDAGCYHPSSCSVNSCERAIACIEGHDVHNEPDRRWVIGSPGDPIYDPVGKKRAGRLLDGRTWDEYPEMGNG